jgi:hypothetical protein
MPLAETPADPKAMPDFLRLVGADLWTKRLADLGRRAQANAFQGRATQHRHALEFALARAARGTAQGSAERRALGFAAEAVRLAKGLPEARREKLRAAITQGLSGEATLIPLFHLLRSAALYRAEGFEVRFTGLAEGSAHDLTISRGGAVAEVVCETISAEEGRPVQRGHWYALMDSVNPELQTWLAAHPGRYVLRMTLPDGLSGPDKAVELQRRIMAMLAAEKRQDSSADAVLKLDPLVLAGAQADPLPGRLRQQFGPEAHLAVTGDPAGGSVFVLAARAGQENSISDAVAARMAGAAAERLSGAKPGIVSVFIEDMDRAEWRSLRDELALEGAVRRFLAGHAARRVVAAACSSRAELFGLAPPDAVAGGELRFRNPSHPAAKSAALAPAILSTSA